MNIFEELKARGLVFQTTDEEALVKALTEGQVSYYTGYDPTADSLHLGHLVAILTSRRLQLAGHKPYALVGGATGLIGDPSFKDAERSLQTKDTVDGWVTKIQGQLKQFLSFEDPKLIKKLEKQTEHLRKLENNKLTLEKMFQHNNIKTSLNKLLRANYYLKKINEEIKPYYSNVNNETFQKERVNKFLKATTKKIEKTKKEIEKLKKELNNNKAVMVNNYDWFSDSSFIDFLRDVGKYYTVNYMMSKDSVKKRIETGISYTEFAYQIMQGYDFYELNDKHNVTLQIGGSDQWGNMTAGTELLRRKADKSGHVMTVPLITDSTGKKFGKSEGNAVWLDADKTSPYEMYQFWLNVMDDDAVRFLKIFTFLSLDEIAEIEEKFDAARHERLAQKILAKEVVTLVHGEEAYNQALNITEQLFAGNIKNLSAKELKQGLSNVPNYAVQAEDNLNIVELLVTSGIVNSKRQAREDVQNGAIYVNGERVQDLDYTLSDSDKIDGELTVIRRGKKKYSVLTY